MLGSLLASFASAETVYAIKRLRSTVTIYAIAVFALLCSAAFFLVAGFILLARSFGAVETAVALGLVFALVALVAVLAHRIAAKAAARRIAARRSGDVRTLAGTAAIALIPTIMRGGKIGLLAPLAAVAAYAIFQHTRRRNATLEDEEEL